MASVHARLTGSCSLKDDVLNASFWIRRARLSFVSFFFVKMKKCKGNGMRQICRETDLRPPQRDWPEFGEAAKSLETWAEIHTPTQTTRALDEAKETCVGDCVSNPVLIGTVLDGLTLKCANVTDGLTGSTIPTNRPLLVRTRWRFFCQWRHVLN